MLSPLRPYIPLIVILFFAFNIGIGLVLVWIAERSPAAAFFRGATGIVGPVISVMALLFGLYSAFLANEVWSVRERARAAVLKESDALRIVLDVTSGVGEPGKKLHALVRDYGTAAATGAWHVPRQLEASRKLLLRILDEALFGSIKSAPPEVQRTIVDAVTAIDAAHRERVLAAQSENIGKWLVAFAFSVMTQVALVYAHLGRPRAALLATTLFAVAAAFSLLAMLGRMEPFDGANPISLAPIQSALSAGDGR